jgi:hypothetical protein
VLGRDAASADESYSHECRVSRVLPPVTL